MASESSFDIVSKVDRHEIDNALNQAVKEVRQRFDFKNTDAPSRGPVRLSSSRRTPRSGSRPSSTCSSPSWYAVASA